MSTGPQADPHRLVSKPPTAKEFVVFDQLPWSKSRMFVTALITFLGGEQALAVPAATHERTSAYCRSLFFRRQTNCSIDLVRYQAFRDSHPEYPSIDRRLLSFLYNYAASSPAAASPSLSSTAASPSHSSAAASPSLSSTAASPSHSWAAAFPSLSSVAASLSAATVARTGPVFALITGPIINPFDGRPDPPIGVPSWQQRAPREELLLQKESTPTTATSTPDEAPYSDKFAKVVEAIQTGRPLEGIRRIPDTVVRPAGITPRGKMAARKKPWEREGVTGGTTTYVDESFPGEPSTEKTKAEDATTSTTETKAEDATTTTTETKAEETTTTITETKAEEATTSTTETKAEDAEDATTTITETKAEDAEDATTTTTETKAEDAEDATTTTTTTTTPH